MIAREAAVVELRQGEKIDRLGYQGLQIIQHDGKFKFTLDAFLLARFIAPPPSKTVLDLGSGSGVLPLLLAGEDKVLQVVGIEINDELADMAQRSMAINGLSEQVAILAADLRELPFELPLNSFDYVISNPPYYPVGAGVISDNSDLATAKFEVKCNLADWVGAAARMVKGNGRVAAVFPASRLTELLEEMQKRSLTPKRLCPVYPKASNDCNTVLVEARPGAKPGLQIMPPLYVYEENGEFTERMNRIFRNEKI